MKNILLGTIFYNSKKELFRIVDIRKSKYVLEKGGETKTVTKKQLSQSYTKLKPNGYIIFSIVESNDDKDVIVALYRTNQDKEEKHYNIPYAVCRQNVINIFDKQINNINRVGMSLSLDSSYDLKTIIEMTACNKIYTAIAVAIYMTDNLDSILSLIDVELFDETLQNMEFKKYFFIPGYCNSLKQLLIQEDFLFDFYKAFDIEKIDTSVNIINDDGLIDPIQTIIFEKLFSVEVFDAYAIEFDYTIRLKDIQKDYRLVYSSVDNKLFVIVFTKGKYYNESMRNEIKELRHTIFRNNVLLDSVEKDNSENI